ncbi:LysE/ArgO family amino acid transporter [Streptomyces anulatus]|uniref:LysE/ArgO family amino acid transporter n=1 Tax=Streptomyces anulatus TaxID=1892 RepID=UPI00386BD3EC
MITALVAGLVAGYGIAVPVGAVAAYLVSLTARTSLRIGVFAALGVATADGLYAFVAVIGGSTIAPLVEPVALPLRWASAAVLVALGLWTGVTAVRSYRRGRTATAAAPGNGTVLTPARAYAGLLGITIMNPMTVIYFTALVLGSDIAATAGHLERVVFVLAAFAASASWQSVLVGGGALLGRVLTGDRGQLVTALASGCLITALAVHLVVSAS